MLRALLAALNPRYWPVFVQQIRKSSDSTPAMLPIAIVGAHGFSGGLLSKIPYAHTALILLFSPFLLVAMIGAALAMYDSLATVLRGGFRGFASSVTWFEIARATLIAGILLSVTSISLLYFDVPSLEVTGIPISISFALFLLGSFVGYLLVAKGQPKSSGSAYECADIFLPQFLACAAIVTPVILLGRYFDPLWIIAYTVASVSTLAALLKIIAWKLATQRDA